MRLDQVIVPRGRPELVVMLSPLGMSVLVVGSWLVTAIAHTDGYAIDHVSATWMALAAHANSGTLYPPLCEGLSSEVRGSCPSCSRREPRECRANTTEGSGPLAVLLMLAILGMFVSARRQPTYNVAFACASVVTAIVRWIHDVTPCPHF